MFDLGKQKIEVKCNCGRKHSVTLQDVSNRKNIKCGCGITIQLTDSGGSVSKSISDINKSMGNLEKSLKRLGK
ncbi:hypothetical protein [Flavobacterium aquiphilum]|uniref:hypothetical protein n=1 Tax=Flavobacterium aquiphilum TaxID=3003261 RepID=UPI0024806A76|nr:hypothetical protein [Flavobacterium aquiphilum]